MIQKQTLPNGTTVLHQRSTGHTASVGLWVKLGSRNESDFERGYTHFLEHMVFKGTEKRTAKQLALEIERVGGFMNAATSREYTYFYIIVSKTELALAIDILTDMVTSALLSPQDIQNEIGVVLEEMKSYEDDPEEFLHDFYYKNFMKNSALGLDIIGTKESVSGITSEKLRAYYESYYIPENTLLSVSCDEESGFVFQLAEKYLGEFKGKGKSPKPDLNPPKQYGKFLHKRKLEQVNFVLGTDGVPKNIFAGAKISLLNTIFGGSMSSRLFQKVREENGLCYSIQSYSSSYVDSGIYSISCGTSKKNFQSAVEIILKEIQELCKNSISAIELADAKTNQKGTMVISYEQADNKMTDIALQELYYQKYYSIEERMKLIDSISREDIEELIQKLYGHGQLHLSVIGDVKEKKFESIEI